MSTHNVLCRKFAFVFRKIATSCSAYFLTHDAAGWVNAIRRTEPGSI